MITQHSTSTKLFININLLTVDNEDSCSSADTGIRRPRRRRILRTISSDSLQSSSIIISPTSDGNQEVDELAELMANGQFPSSSLNNLPTKRKLRIFISNTFYSAKETGEGEEGSVASSELRGEGRLLDDTKNDQNKVKRKFSSFFKSLVIELDKDLYGPDNHLVKWHRTLTTQETDEQIFTCPRMKFAEIPQRLSLLLHPPDPIVINHVEGTERKQTACYDIDVEVDDTSKTQMNNCLSSTASQKDNYEKFIFTQNIP
ncbi:hypothetical protein HCN44_010981 [Aphidius gifuensis]|uniref:Uncharacterized protein n=1 Tax=Aphidius gifuensis TaxID=684658 RepID=A0A834Y7C8_APHGI|nr:hypothetical protein HCN44_010981 [Aphidius gifuensis]